MRCKAKKHDGERCTREAEEEKELCWQHAPDKRGKPTDKYERYWKDRLDIVKKLLMEGLNNKEVAEKMEISEKTFYEWQGRHEDFLQAIREGQKYKVNKLEGTAYQRAQGFKYREEQLTNSGQIVEVEKQALPNVQMLKFLLKNWASGKYKDRKEIDADVDLTLADIILAADEEHSEEPEDEDG